MLSHLVLIWSTLEKLITIDFRIWWIHDHKPQSLDQARPCFCFSSFQGDFPCLGNLEWSQPILSKFKSRIRILHPSLIKWFDNTLTSHMTGRQTLTRNQNLHFHKIYIQQINWFIRIQFQCTRIARTRTTHWRIAQLQSAQTIYTARTLSTGRRIRGPQASGKINNGIAFISTCYQSNVSTQHISDMAKSFFNDAQLVLFSIRLALQE